MSSRQRQRPIIATVAVPLLCLCCFVCMTEGRSQARLLAADLSPRAQGAVDRAVVFLKSNTGSMTRGERALAVYAMLKAGVPANNPVVTGAVALIQKFVRDGKYSPDTHHFYVAALEIMVLESVDPERLKPEMEAITAYILTNQQPRGGWWYPSRRNEQNNGDTSITQYALLGMWTAARAGIEVPIDAWNRAATWLLAAQRGDGSFPYQPGKPDPQFSLGIIAAGAGSLGMVRVNLYPNGRIRKSRKSTNKGPKKKFGVLKKIDLGGKPDKKSAKPKGNPSVSHSALATAEGRSGSWMGRNLKLKIEGWFPYYYFYALERATALQELDRLGGKDWYAIGSAELLRLQGNNGSWKSVTTMYATDRVTTSFAILFFLRSTAKILGPPRKGPEVGTGLLAGGRGLPADLSTVQIQNGKAQAKKKPSSPFEELLAELEKPKGFAVESVQAAIIDKVQLGDRESLIGQKNRLIKLAKHPNGEIRRTALWALGRTGDFRLAPVVIGALEDNDIDVLVEARNALCWLSRKPRGIGLPENPFNGLPENATPAQRKAAVDSWRAEAIKKWTDWYHLVRPYDERDNLDALRRKR